MRKINDFIRRNPDLFAYLPSDVVHPHDQFLARTILRFFPATITPNQITAFRILATPFVVAMVMGNRPILGIVAFLLVALTDALDGSMARTRNQVTRFGMLFDPFADKLLIGAMVVILVFRYYHPWLGAAIIGVELIFIVIALVAKFKWKTVRMANIWGKIKMILQVLAVFLTLAGLVFQNGFLFTIAAWLFGIAIGFAVVSLFAHGI